MLPHFVCITSLPELCLPRVSLVIHPCFIPLFLWHLNNSSMSYSLLSWIHFWISICLLLNFHIVLQLTINGVLFPIYYIFRLQTPWIKDWENWVSFISPHINTSWNSILEKRESWIYYFCSQDKEINGLNWYHYSWQDYNYKSMNKGIFYWYSGFSQI